MISFKELSEKASAIKWKTWIWIGLGLVALPALRIYYVQELLVALIAFSLLFVMLYAAVLTILLLIRASKPVIVWSRPKVGRVVHWSAETARRVAQEAITSPARAKATPLWGKATPFWAKTVPVWAKAVPHHLRSQQLKLNKNYQTVYSRFARLRIRPSYVYRVSLQKGGAALTMGLRTHKRISNQVGNWLTQKVTYADLIRLRSGSRVGSPRSRAQARRPR